MIAAEDGRFCSHRGIDWREITERLDDIDDISEARGVSTITQQTAKNLFLWPGRSFVRKGLEFPLALWIDLVLPKRRVLEIYLNIAEWGPNGQFGAEAGSRYAFNKIRARAERARGRAAGRGTAQSAPAQRQAAGAGGAPARRHLRSRGAAQAALAACAKKPPLIKAMADRAGATASAAAGHASARRSSISPASSISPGFPTSRRSRTMAVPKRKTSPSRRGMRRSADALAQPTYVEDKDSGELRRPHHIDLKTGMYRGRQVLKSKKERPDQASARTLEAASRAIKLVAVCAFAHPHTRC